MPRQPEGPSLVPPRAPEASREARELGPRATARHRVPDRGMQVLEQKLSILALGPSQTRRNPALDVLTGRVPDERLQSLKASLNTKSAPPPGPTERAQHAS